LGDKMRLFRTTVATINGRHGYIGSNGNVVEVVRWTERGGVLWVSFALSCLNQFRILC